MNDMLGRGHVESLDGETKRLGVFRGAGRVAGVLNTGAQLALDGPIPFGGLGVGNDSLLLALDVCHFD